MNRYEEFLVKILKEYVTHAEEAIKEESTLEVSYDKLGDLGMYKGLCYFIDRNFINNFKKETNIYSVADGLFSFHGGYLAPTLGYGIGMELVFSPRIFQANKLIEWVEVGDLRIHSENNILILKF